MGAISIWHWLIVFMFLFVLGYPAARIVRRTGRSGWWAAIIFVPFGLVLGLWLLAFVRWPAADSGTNGA